MGLLEVCVDSVESAVNAAIGGADRLELCGDLVVGGVTPSMELYQIIREKVELSIHVLIRPRFGDFLYNEDELEMMRRQVKAFAKAGADAVVIGCLTRDGRLDWESMDRLMEMADGVKIHLHRAFDMCCDLNQALVEAKQHGIDTILTSGGYASAVLGSTVLRELRAHAGDVTIMAGAGVSAGVIEEIYAQTGITVFHMSGKKEIESEMCYRNPKVNMGLPQLSEYQRLVTDAAAVRDAKAALQRLISEG